MDDNVERGVGPEDLVEGARDGNVWDDPKVQLRSAGIFVEDLLQLGNFLFGAYYSTNRVPGFDEGGNDVLSNIAVGTGK